MKYITAIEDKEFAIEIVDEDHLRVNGRLVEVNFESVNGQPVYSLLLDGKSYESYVYSGDEDWQVLLRGRQFQVKVEDEREKRLRAAGGSNATQSGELSLKAPMPGLVVSVAVHEGQEIKKGDVLIVLESMKMQNELKAPRDGTVGAIKVKAGESVEQKQILLNLQ